MRIVGILLAVVGLALVVVMWRNLGYLRGTVFNDLRFVTFAVGAFLALTLAETITAFLTGRFDKGQ
ncbi:MAG: hypothetical protein AAFW98_00975 [Pseudomonadota bacterium]